MGHKTNQKSGKSATKKFQSDSQSNPQFSPIFKKSQIPAPPKVTKNNKKTRQKNSGKFQIERKARWKNREKKTSFIDPTSIFFQYHFFDMLIKILYKIEEK